MKKKFLAMVVMMLASFVLVACDLVVPTPTPTPTPSTNEYTITFDTNGGDDIASIKFNDTYAASWLKSISVNKDGFKFVSWHFDASLSEESAVLGVISQSVTLYAKWESLDGNTFYTIKFVNEDNTLLELEVLEGVVPVFTGTTPTKPSSQTHDYTFSGWNPALTAASEHQTYQAIFSETLKEGQEPTLFDELNEIMGFDIVSILPAFVATDYDLYEYDEEDTLGFYIDIYNWTRNDYLNYKALLVALFEYDSEYDDYKLTSPEDTYVYVYEEEDDEGTLIYGFEVYRFIDEDGTGGDGDEEPVEGVYYKTNLQSTTSTLASSYKDNSDVELLFNNNTGLVKIYATQAAKITSNPPTGLDEGVVFAAITSAGGNKAYLEFDALGNNIYSLEFNFNGESNTNNFANLIDAYVEVKAGQTWALLPNSNFRNQLVSGETIVKINNIDATHFRLVFVGNTATDRNSGRFMINEVTLNQGEVTPITLWSDVLDLIELGLGQEQITFLLPEFAGNNEYHVNQINSNNLLVKITPSDSNLNNLVTAYEALLVNNDWQLDTDKSLDLETNVYRYIQADDNYYYVYLTISNNQILLNINVFDPTRVDEIPTQLNAFGSINDYQVDNYDYSGLPSTGDVKVLVVPIEIKGVAFDSSYKSNLNKVFNGTSQDTGWESVASFYTKSSYGNLNLTFDIADKYITTNNQTYYENLGDEGDQDAIVDALKVVDNTVDFSQYDANGDGVIDSVIFIYSVSHNLDPEDIIDPWWAWVYVPSNESYEEIGELDGKTLEYYMWASYHFMFDELAQTTLNAETYIHEMGHLFGLDDYYSYDEYYGKLGGFDMMDANAGDHGPANKLLLGWAKPLYATNGSYQVSLDKYTIYDNKDIQQILIIPKNDASFDQNYGYSEYIVMMLFQPEGLYEAHKDFYIVPEHGGIVIYHVNAILKKNVSARDAWGMFEYQNIYEDEPKYFIRILEADKNNSVGGEDSIDYTDLLRSGSLDLSYYKWSDNSKINVMITLNQTITNQTTKANFNLTIN